VAKFYVNYKSSWGRIFLAHPVLLVATFMAITVKQVQCVKSQCLDTQPPLGGHVPSRTHIRKHKPQPCSHSSAVRSQPFRLTSLQGPLSCRKQL